MDDVVDNLVKIMTLGEIKDDLVYPHPAYFPEASYLETPNAE